MEKKRLNLLLPASLLKTHAKLCIDLGITQTQGIIQYLACVQDQEESRNKTEKHVPICFNLGKSKPKDVK